LRRAPQVMPGVVQASEMSDERPRFWSFPRGGAWVLAGLAIGGLAIYQGVDTVAVEYNKPKLEALYSMLRELRVGMPREEVLEVVKRHTIAGVEEHRFDNGDITLWVHYGNIDSCSLTIGFNGNSLAIARTVGEDGAEDKCPMAPPDLMERRSPK
jgi:hypothetical protein